MSEQASFKSTYYFHLLSGKSFYSYIQDKLIWFLIINANNPVTSAHVQKFALLSFSYQQIYFTGNFYCLHLTSILFNKVLPLCADYLCLNLM